MNVSDLFSASTRDQAVLELPDDELIVAATVVASAVPTDSLSKEWLATDIAWLAMNCDHPSSAATIIRHGSTVVTPKLLFEQFVAVTHYLPKPLDRVAALRSNGSDIPERVAHVLAQRHGDTVFSELIGIEAHRVTSHDARSDAGWFSNFIPLINDVDLLRSLVGCERVFTHNIVIQRLWELGEHHLVLQIADSVPDFPVVDSAKRAANNLLMVVDPLPRAKTGKRR